MNKLFYLIYVSVSVEHLVITSSNGPLFLILAFSPHDDFQRGGNNNPRSIARSEGNESLI
jgi:hypothetical protein